MVCNSFFMLPLLLLVVVVFSSLPAKQKKLTKSMDLKMTQNATFVGEINDRSGKHL